MQGFEKQSQKICPWANFCWRKLGTGFLAVRSAECSAGPNYKLPQSSLRADSPFTFEGAGLRPILVMCETSIGKEVIVRREVQ